MAAPNKLDKMAVTVDSSSLNSNVFNVNSREDTDQKTAGVSGQKSDGMYAKKKSTFKITSVTKSRGEGQNDADADSTDDLDETVESHTEDISSEILDSSKYTDIGDQDTPLEETTQTTFGQESEAVSVSKEVNKEGKSADAHSTQTRFKVVKIETKEPFKRGRWTCHDLLDDRLIEKIESKIVTTDRDREEQANSGNSSASSSVHYVHGVDDPSKNPLMMGQGVVLQNDSYIHQSDNTGDKIMSKLLQGAAEMSNSPYIQHPQTPSNTQIPSSLQTHQMQNYSGVSTNNAVSPVQNMTQTSSDPRGQQQGHVQNAIQSQPSKDHVMLGSQHSNLVTHKGNAQMTPQIPSSVIPVSIKGHILTPKLDGMTPQGQKPQISGVTPATGGQVPMGMINTGATDYVQTPQVASIPQHVTGDTKDRQTKEGSIPLNPGILPSQSDSEQSSVDRKLEDTNPVFFYPSSRILDIPVSASPILTPLAVAEAVGVMSSPTKEDERWKFRVERASGSSTVAIDNKIEQAMDLVKSHLMYAVREEVEVLKEQIKELIEKNSQLEYENSILKAAASQETLQKLSQPRQQQPPSSSS